MKLHAAKCWRIGFAAGMRVTLSTHFLSYSQSMSFFGAAVGVGEAAATISEDVVSEVAVLEVVVVEAVMTFCCAVGSANVASGTLCVCPTRSWSHSGVCVCVRRRCAWTTIGAGRCRPALGLKSNVRKSSGSRPEVVRLPDGFWTVSGPRQFEVRKTSTHGTRGGRFPDAVYEVTRFVSCRRCSCEFTPEIMISKYGNINFHNWTSLHFSVSLHIWKTRLPYLEIIFSGVNSQLQRLQLTNRVTSYTTSGKRPPTAREVDVFRTSNWQGPETVRKVDGRWTEGGRCFRPAPKHFLSLPRLQRAYISFAEIQSARGGQRLISQLID